MANEITISTNENDIRSMLIKLMGRGMMLSQKIEGQFVLSLEDIADLINKVAQRVQLQNHCKMSDFYAEFGFEDGSRETVPTFEALQAYRSINPSVCTSCNMSFAFLIDFQSRGVEKQAIDIALNAKYKGKSRNKSSIILDEDFTFGEMEIKIEYTDVTWANDIKNLFEKYCEVHINKYKLRQAVAPFFGFKTFPFLLMPMALIASIFASSRRDASAIKERLSDVLSEIQTGDALHEINGKIDILIYKQNDVKGFWEIASPIIIIFAILIIALLSSFIIKSVPRSAILLSAESRKVYDRNERSRSRINLFATGGILVSIAVSVLSANIDRLILRLFGE